MSIAIKAPNTIMLSPRLPDEGSIVNDLPVGVAGSIPGMLMERYNNSGSLNWRPNSSATEMVEIAVLLDEKMWNRTVDAVPVVGDLVPVWTPRVGQMFLGIVPSGQTIALGALLGPNGDGRLKAAGSTTAAGGVAKFRSEDALGAVVADTRVRARRIA